MPTRYSYGSYPGGKNGAGVYQRLINQIPPHDIYIETHLGGGAIMRLKKPTIKNIGIDIDPDVIHCWKGWREKENQSISIHNIDANSFLNRWRTMYLYRNKIPIVIKFMMEKTFIFCDPPYLMETRKSGPLYRYEYTREQHIELLKLLLSLDAMIMITGYRSDLYDDMLSGWRRMDYMAPTRQGMVPESAWMNYPEPSQLHDYRYLGENFRERERIRRKVKRWKKNLDQLPVLERQAILEAVNSL